MLRIDTERAVRLNRRYMQADSLGWATRMQEISTALGITNQTPGERLLAERVAQWQSMQMPPMAVDGIIGRNTWGRLQREPGYIGQLAARRVSHGPQTYLPGVPGGIPLDSALVSRNLAIEDGLLGSAERYYRDGDFRWFFTYAHGQITRQINRNLLQFQRPNVLLRLNIHFAEEFLRAISSQPHEDWKRAFRICSSLQAGAEETIALMGEVEFCGAAMANVHIFVDLSKALEEVGCIPRDDYGNMLIFVRRGALAALVRLRGRALGAAEAILQGLVGELVRLEVKQWRNAVFEEACNQTVPDPSTTFMTD